MAEDGDSNWGAIVVALVVGALLIVGFVLMVPAFRSMSAYRHGPYRVNCQGNLKQIGLALIIYAGDDVENGMYPSGPQFSKLNEQQYLVDGPVYSCPECSSPNTLAAESNYAYLGEGLSDMHPKATKVIVAHDRLGNHANWVNCVYLDGHVQGHATTAASWEAFRKEREAAGDIILNEPIDVGITPPGMLPTYQVLE